MRATPPGSTLLARTENDGEWTMSSAVGAASAADRRVIAVRRVLVPAAIVVIVLTILALILNANVFSSPTDAYAYGRIDIPGSAVEHLPAERIEVIIENPLGGGIDVPRHLAASIVPIGGGSPAPLVRSIGGQFGASGSHADYGDDFRRVWWAQVPRAGAYRVTVTGGGSDSGLSLDLGHGPPISSVAIWEIAGIVELALIGVWLLTRVLMSGARAEASGEPAGP
jgi:hypothetical protein